MIHFFDSDIAQKYGINAAVLAQGDCERAAEFWETMSNDDLFSEKDKGFLEVINRQVNLNTLYAPIS